MALYLYLGYTKKKRLLKIGISLNLKLRFAGHRMKYKDIILIGYKRFENGDHAREIERKFAYKRSNYRNEWFPFSTKSLNEFRNIENFICVLHGKIEQLDFPIPITFEERDDYERRKKAQDAVMAGEDWLS